MNPSAPQMDSIPKLIEEEHHESYFELVWRRFKRSKASIFGALCVVMLGILFNIIKVLWRCRGWFFLFVCLFLGHKIISYFLIGTGFFFLPVR